MAQWTNQVACPKSYHSFSCNFREIIAIPVQILHITNLFASLFCAVHYSAPKLVILHMNMALHVYEDIMRMTENLSEKYIIGYGASSTVYKCVLKNCKPVAIKKLYSHYSQSLKEFETELETVGSIKHRNLVSLQGYSLSPSGNLLFYDYMENGSLWDVLHGKQALLLNSVLQVVSICCLSAVSYTF